MAEPIDISLPLHAGMVVWPGGGGFNLTRAKSLDRGDTANVSHLSCDVHVGTHLDAPLHFLRDGATVDQLPLTTLLGPCTVVDLADARAVTAEALGMVQLAPGVTRLLLKTRNSREWAAQSTGFREDYVALTASAATWIVQRGIRLLGVDYLSVQRYKDGPEVHRILLEAGIVIVEGLNLAGVTPGQFTLLCLPLRLVGAEGAPARVVLLSEQLA